MAWLTELKIDGLAISLRYEDGVLTSAAQRLALDPRATGDLGDVDGD